MGKSDSTAKRPVDPRRKAIKDKHPAAALVTDSQRDRALEMRKLGYTFADIAKALGVAESTAHGYVEDGWTRLNQRADESRVQLRRIQEYRLERAAREAMSVIIAEGLIVEAKDREGNVMQADAFDAKCKAIDRLVKVSQRQCVLRGLDEPTQIEDVTPRRRLVPLPVLERMVREKKSQEEVEREMEDEERNGDTSLT